MPYIGSSTGQTVDFTLTRDQLIALAHKVIGVLEPGQVLDGEQLQDGIDLLGLIVRETDAAGKHRWTVQEATQLPLKTRTFYYDSNSSLPTMISDLLSASFRTGSTGRDVTLKILKAEEYETITDKMQYGTPQGVYLTEQIDLSLRGLYIWPLPTDVGTQSVVTGTDGQTYRCIRSHEADSTNQPVSGANWRLVWELGGSSPAAWASGTDYVAPMQIRLLYRRPIYDFLAADSQPDFPRPWPRHLLYKLAFDLGDLYGIPMDERNLMINKAKGAYEDLFPSAQVKGQNLRPRVRYF